jgi:hypothetical protein
MDVRIYQVDTYSFVDEILGGGFDDRKKREKKI